MLDRKRFVEECLETEQLFSGLLLNVHRDTVRLPSGGESVREWIDHPGASAVVPLFDDESTLLIRQYRYPPRRLFVEVPAGKIDVPGESPEHVAERELEEETGWCAARLIKLGAFYPCIGYSNEIIHLYLGEQLTRGRDAEVEGEFVEPFRVSLQEALTMVRSGEILDMKSILALMMAAEYVQNRKETPRNRGR